MQILGATAMERAGRAFRIEDVVVNSQQKLLRRDQRRVPLEAKTMGVLTYLAENAGAVIAREELLNQVWGEFQGSDEALSRAVSLCRGAFAQLGASNPIRTVPRRGYTLIAEVAHDFCLSRPERSTASEARALYLKGRTKAARIANPHDLAEAVSLLRQATQLDPGFAPGWAGLAHAQATAAGHTPFGDRLAQIRLAGRNAGRAIELDYRQHLAHSVRAQLLLAERDVIGAIEAAKIARLIAPSDADAAMWLGHCYSLIGLFDLALPLLELAVALDPLQGRRHMILAVGYVADGEYDAAETAALQAIDLGFLGGHEPYAAAAYMRGRPDQAVDRFNDALEHFTQIYKREPRFRSLLGFAARGIYGESEACKSLLLSAAIPAASFRKGSAEGLLSYIFLRTGSPGFFTSSFGTRILPGNSIVLPYLYDASPGALAIRTSSKFSKFIETLGIQQAWERFGFPKAKVVSSSPPV